MTGIEEVLGYRFRQKGLLEEALTHPSCAKAYNNQRLEFLGDTVLGLMVAKLLFRQFPNEKEGGLAKRHAALVCGEALVAYVREKNLAPFLIMSDGEAASGGGENPANLEDMSEALFGAVYLDGGLEAVEQVFLPHWQMLAQNIKEPPRDPKTTLQEWAQARGMALPVYSLKASEGPAHAPIFTMEVTLDDGTVFSATATTKRMAEREAARLVLEHLEAKQHD